MPSILVLDEYALLNSSSVTSFSDESISIIYSSGTDGAEIMRPVVVLSIQRTVLPTEQYKAIRAAFPGSLILPVSNVVDLQVIQNVKKYASSPVVGSIPSPLLTYIASEIDEYKAPSYAAGKSIRYVTGQSKTMQEVYELVDLVAPTNYHVVIYGETGTGKEALARLIHAASTRRGKPFVAVDCGCLNVETAISEFFGHVKGAFTDAIAEKTGVFEAAIGGTLFLDEIGNLPPGIQICLLRSIQEKMIRKIGSNQEIAIDVRLIAATNENLEEKPSFRKDLYYRLNEMTISLPPLRDRKEDLSLLVQHFVAMSNESLGKHVTGLSNEAWQKVWAYAWPGNIRELKNAINRASLLTAAGSCIQPEALPFDLIGQPEAEEKEEAWHAHNSLKEAAARAEYAKILNALKSTQFNKSKTAAILNIHRKTLYNKLKLMKMSV